MSDLFRKEALENRSRALFGEVILRGPISSWILTLLILIITAVCVAILFGLTIETEGDTVSLITWLLGGT